MLKTKQMQMADKMEQYEQEDKEISLDTDMIRKWAMKGDLTKVFDLCIQREGVTEIDIDAFKELEELKKLDVAFNRLSVFRNIDTCRNITDLNLSFNKLTKIDGLQKLANLKSLVIDNNFIEKIEGLKNNRRLQYLSLQGNKLKDLTYTETVLAELKSLSVARNEIEQIVNLTWCPGLEDLDLKDNTQITLIEESVFQSTQELLSLNLTRCQLQPNILDFLGSCKNLLSLSMK